MLEGPASVTPRHHAIFHSVAAQFTAATNGEPYFAKFWPWLNAPEQHELRHAFLTATAPDFTASAEEFLNVLCVEYNRWHAANEQDGHG